MPGRLLAIGDIHGCFDTFRELVHDVVKLDKSDRLILLGDYIDRGEKSREVIDLIMALQDSGYDIVPLIGNHESMLLDASRDERLLQGWFLNGGYDTMLSFGIADLAGLDNRYLEFMKRLGYFYSFANYLFVHAGFNNELADPFEDRTQMIWSRRETYTNAAFKGKIIIHGHTPVTLTSCISNIESGSMVINIDTGCVYGREGGYGNLTALDLYTMKHYSVPFTGGLY